MKIANISCVGLLFDNGTRVEDFHVQDCCESVYADWEQLKDTDVFSHEFPENLTIDGVDGSGIRIDGYFIPCYNRQNGYYSSQLGIYIIYPDKTKKEIDISNYVEEDIG